MRGGTRFNTYNVFRGILWSGENLVESLDDYLDRSEVEGLQQNWFEQLTDKYSDYHNCAVVVSWAEDRDEWEYNYRHSGFKDFKNTGSGGWYVMNDPTCSPDYL